MKQYIVILVLAALTAVLSSCSSTANINLAPIYQQEVTDNQTFRRALGPLYESSKRKNGDQLLCVRPFYAKVIETEREFTAHDFLWPFHNDRKYNNTYTSKGITSSRFRRDLTDPEAHYYNYILFL